MTSCNNYKYQQEWGSIEEIKRIQENVVFPETLDIKVKTRDLATDRTNLYLFSFFAVQLWAITWTI